MPRPPTAHRRPSSACSRLTRFSSAGRSRTDQNAQSTRWVVRWVYRNPDWVYCVRADRRQRYKVQRRPLGSGSHSVSAEVPYLARCSNAATVLRAYALKGTHSRDVRLCAEMAFLLKLGTQPRRPGFSGERRRGGGNPALAMRASSAISGSAAVEIHESRKFFERRAALRINHQQRTARGCGIPISRRTR